MRYVHSLFHRTETLSIRENRNTKILAKMKTDKNFLWNMKKQLSTVLNNKLKEFNITTVTSHGYLLLLVIGYVIVITSCINCTATHAHMYMNKYTNVIFIAL